MNRRRMLGAMGAGAAAVGASGLIGTGPAGATEPVVDPAAAATPSAAPASAPASAPAYSAPAGHNYDWPGQFSRMFPDLPPFAQPSPELEAALIELSKPGGLLDANDPVEVGPFRLLTEPQLSPDNPDNPVQTAGVTFMGQFIDHDLTRDGGSPLGRVVDLRRSRNLRSPRLDLDTVYGDGPFWSPQLYEGNWWNRKSIRFKVESGGLFEDVPRKADGTAILGDPRNDENLILSGLHAAFLLFHNRVAERVEAERKTRGWSYWDGGWAAFEETRRLVRWHWQWIVLNDYLPTIVNRSVVDDVKANGARFFQPRRPTMPVEFQGAAYRFGHSQVRPSYRLNLAGDNGKPFFALVFDPNQAPSSDPATLQGGFRAPRRFIGWQTFFDFGDGQVRPNKKVDTKISTPLFRLPSSGVIDLAPGEGLGPTSLATRNLLRHITWALPSGQAIAQRMGVEPLSAADLSDLEPFGAGLAASTPLWFYILREAEVFENGERLGQVGGRIVAEVLHTLIKRDSGSYLYAQPDWKPTLPSAAGPGQFWMGDLLRVAGVDPGSRGQ